MLLVFMDPTFIGTLTWACQTLRLYIYPPFFFWVCMECFVCFFFGSIFFNIFIDYVITVVPFPPLHSILPTPFLPHSPTIVHVHGSYLQVLWLLHFLHYSSPLPVYFPPIIYAIYSLYLSPLSPPPNPLLITLHVISISVVLFLF